MRSCFGGGGGLNEPMRHSHAFCTKTMYQCITSSNSDLVSHMYLGSMHPMHCLAIIDQCSHLHRVCENNTCIPAYTKYQQQCIEMYGKLQFLTVCFSVR